MDKKRKAPGRNIDNNFTGFKENEFQNPWLKYDIEPKVTWNASNPEHRAELRKLGIVAAEVDPEAALGLAQAIHSHDVDGVEGEAFQSTIHRYTMQGEIVNDVMRENGFDDTLRFLDKNHARKFVGSHVANVQSGMRAHKDDVNEDNNLARMVVKVPDQALDQVSDQALDKVSDQADKVPDKVFRQIVQRFMLLHGESKVLHTIEFDKVMIVARVFAPHF